jgi:hypothetical protein
MTLNELIEEVYIITMRPDLVAMTKSAVKAATLKLHKTDFYSKDIFETGIQFDTIAYVQGIDLYTLIPNFRAMKYLRVSSEVITDQGTFIDVVTPEETLDMYGMNRTDVAYVAGRVLEVRTSQLFVRALLGCYVYPTVTDAGYATWMAEQYSSAIVYEAARAVFSSIGYLEQANGMRQLMSEELTLLRKSAVTDVGY